MGSKKFPVIISEIIFVTFLLILSNSVKAETLCSYAGPDLSEDFLRLTNFTVTGPASMKVGDIITVKFNLQNYGQYDLKLGSKGIFVATGDPNNSDVSFGFTRANTTFETGEIITVSASKILDKAGIWKFWPSYHLTFAGAPEKFGPNEWHACTIQVTQPVLDSDGDGVPDDEDNCPQNYNPQQEDIDGDNIGDVCDACDDRDTDKDKIKNCLDKCPNEPENYNDYQDEDGCLDTPKGTIIKITKTPKEPKLGDRIKIEINATDIDGVKLLKLYLNGKERKRCFGGKCSYTTQPIDEEPQIGVMVIDNSNNVETEGFVPEDRVAKPWWFEDDDGDGIENIADNCRDIANSIQKDSDNDGVGDECDSCDAELACSLLPPGGIFIPEAGGYVDYTTSYCCGSCTTTGFVNGIPYFEAFYDLISRDGCGCKDWDGIDYFTRSGVYNEFIDIKMIGRLTPSCTSNCESLIDECIDNDNLLEYICTSNGVENITINCPAGCSNGACNCPDSDGGWNYYEGGGLYILRGYVQDVCLDENHLKEVSCGGIKDNAIVPAYRNITCNYGCRTTDRGKGACNCIDSDNGRNYEEKGVVYGTTYEDFCYCENCPENRTLVEYYFEIISDKCFIHNETHLCEGLCSDGKCIRPTCNDGVKNQGEEDIDCGGPCVPCNLCDAEMLPRNFTWTNWKGRNWITPVKDQGECGSCWAFATIGAVEAKYNIENEEAFMNGTLEDHYNENMSLPEALMGIYRQKEVIGIDLSEQHLINNPCGGAVGHCCPHGTCKGGSLLAFSCVKWRGVPTESCQPYSRKSLVEGENYKICSKNSCGSCWKGGWGDLWTIDDVSTVGTIKRDLVCHGPISACGGGHCVLIVGWDDDMVNKTVIRYNESTGTSYYENITLSTGAWIIKNSWGVGWVELPDGKAESIGWGFGYVPYGHRWINWLKYPKGVHVK